jgi:hypothetical protein
LEQHGNIETGEAHGIRDGSFVSEVREGYQDAFDFVAMVLEKVGALPSVGESFNGAAFSLIGGETDRFVALLFEDAQDFHASVAGQGVGEKASVAYDDSESGHLLKNNWPLMNTDERR